MSHFIEPRSFIEARRVDDESGVILPMAYRESVISGVRRSFRVHFLWKFSSVHPDFTPDSLLLIFNEDTIRSRPEQDASAHADCMGQNVPGKPEGVTGDKWIVRGRKTSLELGAVRQVGMPLFEYRFARG